MSTVQLYVYDITQGMARSMSMMLIGEQIDAVYHTGVVVFGHEFFFGGGPTAESGISAVPPGTLPIGRPQEVIQLGRTEIPEELFYQWLEEVGASIFAANKYHLLKHNCNNFSEAVSQFLLSESIPAHITGLPERVMATPFGQMMRPMIENMMSQMSAQGESVESVHHPIDQTPSAPRPSDGSSAAKPEAKKKTDDDLDLD